MFDDDFLKALPEDPYEAAEEMCQAYFAWANMPKPPAVNKVESRRRYRQLVEAFVAMETFSEVKGLQIKQISLGPDEDQNTAMINQYFYGITQYLDERSYQEMEDSARLKYKRMFDAGFFYEFSDGDLERIQTLINELRDAITESNLFEEDHKQRLLKRLEKLQSELHKKMSTLDQFWGLMGEAGVALGKFGTDAKPFVDRIVELRNIAWRTQARKEELPSASQFPRLEDGEKVE